MDAPRSEEINIKDGTTGAPNDLEMATQMARKMVCQYGMSQKLGNITLGKRGGLVFLGRDLTEERNYSEDTAKKIDAPRGPATPSLPILLPLGCMGTGPEN